jgi:hypothetical protein
MQGDMGQNRLPNYSRGIRQKVFKLAQEEVGAYVTLQYKGTMVVFKLA